MGFEDYLLSLGYKRFRKVYANNKFEYVDFKHKGFSSMMPGGLDVRYIKDNDFDNEIIFGLSEKDKPPTLVYPRPRIKYVTDSNYMNEVRDDAMNVCLLNETPEDIFKAMYDDSILFTYINKN